MAKSREEVLSKLNELRERGIIKPESEKEKEKREKRVRKSELREKYLIFRIAFNIKVKYIIKKQRIKRKLGLIK